MKKIILYGMSNDQDFDNLDRWHDRVIYELRVFRLFKGKRIRYFSDLVYSSNDEFEWSGIYVKGSSLRFWRLKKWLLKWGYNMDVSHKGLWYVADPSIPKGDLV